MADFNCENPCIACPPAPPGTVGLSPNDPNNPFLNLSSEAPDVDTFNGRGYTDGKPPLGQVFYAVGCIGFCVGTTQEEANLCAARQNMLCNSGNWPVTNPNPNYNPRSGGNGPNSNPNIQTPRPLYSNTEQTCTVSCPDGSTNSSTVPAGTIYAFNQATADANAYSRAKRQAELSQICLSSLGDDIICLGEENSLTIQATNVFVDTIFSVSAGELPTGMQIEDIDVGVAQIYGTPTSNGFFVFTVRCVDSTGTSGERDYTLGVFGITTDSPLPEAVINVLYSETLSATEIFGDVTWSIVGGSLPSWLSLDSSTGTLSGTPTIAGIGDFSFTVQAASGGATCSKDFQLTATCCFSNGNPPDADTTPVAYSFQLVPCQTADPTYAYSITAGSLPPGLTLGAATGLISGNPTTPGTYPFTVGLTGVQYPCSSDYTIEAKCQPSISDVEPGHMGNLALGAAGTVSLGPFYIIQRTGAGKTMNFRGVGPLYTRAGMAITFGTKVFNDETSVYLGFWGGNSVTGGGGGDCGTLAMDDSGGLALNSCTRYRLEPFIIITGAPQGFCTSSFDYYATWL